MTTIYSSRRFISTETIRAGALVVQRFYEWEDEKRGLVSAACFDILESKVGMTQFNLVRALMKKTHTTNAVAASVIRELRSEGKIREDLQSCLISIA